MKTRPFIAERLLMGRKESNQTNKQNNILSCLCFFRQDSVGLSYFEVEHLISSLDEITDYLTQHLADLDNEVIIEIKQQQ